MENAQNLPHDDEGPAILAATFTVTIVAFITMVVRLYVRIKMIRNVGWDDYTMIAAMMMCIAGQCLIVPEVKLGAGKHIWDIPPENFSVAYKLNFITQPIYLVAICTVKMSIGFFLLRVAVTSFYRRTIIGIMVFMSIYTLGCFFTVVLQCTNLAVMWDRNVKGTCWSVTTLKALSYTNVSLNILTDLLFAIFIPIPMLWKVQMRRRQKASIIGILSLGIFATAACLVKVGYLPNYGKEGDWLWDSRNITIWTVVECNTGIIAGNLPCLKPLFRSVLGSTYGRGSRNGKTPKYISRPYGNGSGHAASKNYNSLGSDKTDEGVYSNKAFGEDNFVMTSVKGKERSGSGTSSRDDTHSKNSAESVAWLNTNNQSLGKLGGITRTTEVNVNRSHPPPGEIFEDGMKLKRTEAEIV